MAQMYTEFSRRRVHLTREHRGLWLRQRNVGLINELTDVHRPYEGFPAAPLSFDIIKRLLASLCDNIAMEVRGRFQIKALKFKYELSFAGLRSKAIDLSWENLLDTAWDRFMDLLYANPLTSSWTKLKNRLYSIGRMRTAALWVALVITISLGLPFAGYAWYQAQHIDVEIYVDGDQLYTLRTMLRSVAEVLEEFEISLRPEDSCLPLPDTEFDTALQIYIEKAIPVEIDVDGVVFQIYTLLNTVDELLVAQGIKLYNEDRCEPHGDTVLEAGLMISVIRVGRYRFVQEFDLPYSVLRYDSSALGVGYEQQIREGREGLRQRTVEVIQSDGVDVEWIIVSDDIVAWPIDELIHVGTAGVAEFDELSFPYQKMYIMESTGYCPCYLCCGKHEDHPAYGLTISGMQAGRGGVGADLSYFPIGTKLYIEGYGYAVVGDTGAGVIGRMRIDLGFTMHQEAYDWGLQHGTAVYVLFDD